MTITGTNRQYAFGVSELVRFDRFMDWALYDPVDGFYSSGRGAGRRGGDFITSPEVGPLFGRLIARYLDQVWSELGRPDPYLVAEAAAGTGTLARSVLSADPACASALRYHLVEVAAPARVAHQSLLEQYPTTAVSLRQWPARCHVGFANELLDNLPVRVIDTTDTPVELYAQHDTGVWTPAWQAIDTDLPEPIGATTGIVPWAQRARAWIEQAAASCERVVIVDYGADTAALATRGFDGWLRCYRDHQRLADPFMAPGFTDITADVPVDQLPTPVHATRQAAWLEALGIDELADAAAQQWRETAHIGDLGALRARSTVHEANALCDPDGLGGFWVLIWGGA